MHEGAFAALVHVPTQLEVVQGASYSWASRRRFLFLHKSLSGWLPARKTCGGKSDSKEFYLFRPDHELAWVLRRQSTPQREAVNDQLAITILLWLSLPPIAVRDVNVFSISASSWDVLHISANPTPRAEASRQMIMFHKRCVSRE